MEFRCGFTMKGGMCGTNEAFAWASSVHVPVSFAAIVAT